MNNPKTIVVVDDNQTNAELLEEYLGENGFEVSLAFTAQEGFKKIIETRPDIVLLDLFLPDMMGSDVCSQLRMNDITRNIPVILCTAHTITHTEKMKGFRAGVDDYLIRPFELSELLARINAILRRTRGDQTPSHPKIQTDVPHQLFSHSPHPSNAHPHAEPLPLLTRIWEVLNYPGRVFKNIKERSDFLISLVLVLATPALASFAKLSQRSGGFDAWIGVFSLGLVIHLVMWFGTAGLLHLVIPFQGINLSMKKALTLAGLSWAPRFLGAILAAIYTLLTYSTGWVGEPGPFSSGLDILPGLSVSEGTKILSYIGLFDVWCAGITLIAVWTVCKINERRWNPVTIAIGISCLLFGAFTNY